MRFGAKRTCLSPRAARTRRQRDGEDIMESIALSTILQCRPDLNTPLVRRAVAMTLEAHAGQLRESGDPAASHPVNVAAWIARSGADGLSVVAAVLHDVVEDTD